MRPPCASAPGGRGTRSPDQSASGGRPGPPPGGSRTGPPSGGRGIRPGCSASGGQHGPPPTGVRPPSRSTSGGHQGPPPGGHGIRPPPCFYATGDRREPTLPRPTRTDAATEEPVWPTVRTMRSSPRVVDLPDSTSDSDVSFNDDWPEVCIEPADFLVPPPATETADAATSTPPLPEPEPELGVPHITIEQLARRTATAMAGRPHLRIDQSQDWVIRDMRETIPITPGACRTISAAVEMGVRMVSLMCRDLLDGAAQQSALRADADSSTVLVYVADQLNAWSRHAM